MAGDREDRDSARELLTDEPMAPTTAADQSDILTLPSNPNEKSVPAAPPAGHDLTLGRIEWNVTRHSSGPSQVRWA